MAHLHVILYCADVESRSLQETGHTISARAPGAVLSDRCHYPGVRAPVYAGHFDQAILAAGFRLADAQELVAHLGWMAGVENRSLHRHAPIKSERSTKADLSRPATVGSRSQSIYRLLHRETWVQH